MMADGLDDEERGGAQGKHCPEIRRVRTLGWSCREVGHQRQEQQGHDRNRKAQGEGCRSAEDMGRDGPEPIGQWRMVGPRLVIVSRRGPVAGLAHRHGGFGDVWFIRKPEVTHPRPGDQEDHGDDQEQGACERWSITHQRTQKTLSGHPRMNDCCIRGVTHVIGLESLMARSLTCQVKFPGRDGRPQTPCRQGLEVRGAKPLDARVIAGFHPKMASWAGVEPR
jgi:hypothetical protein